jgi:hypothetical protein
MIGRNSSICLLMVFVFMDRIELSMFQGGKGETSGVRTPFVLPLYSLRTSLYSLCTPFVLPLYFLVLPCTPFVFPCNPLYFFILHRTFVATSLVLQYAVRIVTRDAKVSVQMLRPIIYKRKALEA